MSTPTQSRSGCALAAETRFVQGQRTLLWTGTCTCLALLAFAANSLLCRRALGDGLIDAAGFSTIRLAAGAVALMGILVLRGQRSIVPGRRNFGSAVFLFGYAIGFSFAYLKLSAGIGALLLFAAVQCTMITAALVLGERPHPFEWIGLSAALVGLGYQAWPGVDAPDPFGAALMVVAGISWGFYSIRGRSEANPLQTTAKNFLLAIPMAMLTNLVLLRHGHLTRHGVILAILSGALASGAGYAVWYAALQGLTGLEAAIVQLPVPVLTALGGMLFLAETVTGRLVASVAIILGGVSLAIYGSQRRARRGADSPK